MPLISFCRFFENLFMVSRQCRTHLVLVKFRPWASAVVPLNKQLSVCVWFRKRQKEVRNMNRNKKSFPFEFPKKYKYLLPVPSFTFHVSFISLGVYKKTITSILLIAGPKQSHPGHGVRQSHLKGKMYGSSKSYFGGAFFLVTPERCLVVLGCLDCILVRGPQYDFPQSFSAERHANQRLFLKFRDPGEGRGGRVGPFRAPPPTNCEFSTSEGDTSQKSTPATSASA